MKLPRFRMGSAAVAEAFTKLERAALKLLIGFAWGHGGQSSYEARKLVIEALHLDDSRPVDTQARKAALNAFCETPDPS